MSLSEISTIGAWLTAVAVPLAILVRAVAPIVVAHFQRRQAVEVAKVEAVAELGKAIIQEHSAQLRARHAPIERL